MKVSEIFKTMNDIERLRGVLATDGYHLTNAEISKIRDLLWGYRNKLLKKEVK